MNGSHLVHGRRVDGDANADHVRRSVVDGRGGHAVTFGRVLREAVVGDGPLGVGIPVYVCVCVCTKGVSIAVCTKTEVKAGKGR